MRVYLNLILAALLLMSSILGALAQEPDPPQSPTWDDAPNTFPIRHIGDWMVAAGWHSPEAIHGPFIDPNAPYEIGDELSFSGLLYSMNADSYTYVLVHRSEYAYFWFLPSTSVDLEAVQAAGRYFDTVIRPQVTRILNAESQDGIDGDPRIHIVHEEFIGFGAVGVFRPDDQCPIFLCPASNQRDVLYYSLDWGPVNSEPYLTTIAHEYQHVIRFQVDGNERRWMNEGLSQVIEHLNGFSPEYSVGRNLNLFLENPDHRLDGWADLGGDPSIYYGSSFLFLLYLYEHYGLDFITALSSAGYDGLAAVHHTLQNTTDVSLDEVFSDWLIANYLDDPFIGEGQYYYATLTLPLQVQTTRLTPPATLSRQINQYGGNYFELDGGSYDLLFDGEQMTSLVGASPADGKWMWWSYNAEASATRLSRHVDLREVDSATLLYDLWYDVEQDFDWVNIMASLDDGRTWKPLQSSHMRPAADKRPVPHYTGRSPGWISDEIDLSQYAGSRILLRFEYISDGSITHTGALLDNIRIPEIGFSDDAETLDPTWELDGFIRVPEFVDQNWSLHLITKGRSPRVYPLDLSAENLHQSTLEIPAEGGVLIIGAMAPLTANKAGYKLVIAASED